MLHQVVLLLFIGVGGGVTRGEDNIDNDTIVNVNMTITVPFDTFPSEETKRLIRISMILVDVSAAVAVTAMFGGSGGMPAVAISRQALVLRQAECEFTANFPYASHPLRLSVEGSIEKGTAVCNVALCAGLFLVLFAASRVAGVLKNDVGYMERLYPGVVFAIIAFLAPPTVAAGVSLMILGDVGYGVLGIAPAAVFYLSQLLFFPVAYDSAVVSSEFVGRVWYERYFFGSNVWQSAVGGTHLQRMGLMFKEYQEASWVYGRYILLESLSSLAVAVGFGIGSANGSHQSCLATNLVLIVSLTIQILTQITSGLYVSPFATHISDLMLFTSIGGLVGVTAFEVGGGVEAIGAWSLFISGVFCLVHSLLIVMKLILRAAGVEPEVYQDEDDDAVYNDVYELGDSQYTRGGGVEPRNPRMLADLRAQLGGLGGDDLDIDYTAQSQTSPKGASMLALSESALPRPWGSTSMNSNPKIDGLGSSSEEDDETLVWKVHSPMRAANRPRQKFPIRAEVDSDILGSADECETQIAMSPLHVLQASLVLPYTPLTGGGVGGGSNFGRSFCTPQTHRASGSAEEALLEGLKPVGCDL